MLPKPIPSLVINYFYLWKYEQQKGQEGGVKQRPCVILSAQEQESGLRVIVSPVTTTKPDTGAAIEIPAKVAHYLGLKEDVPSYIVCSEVNLFIWPGVDISSIQGDKGKFSFGYLPPKLFDKVKEQILRSNKDKTLKVVARKS